jgi:hypothetical protein
VDRGIRTRGRLIAAGTLLALGTAGLTAASAASAPRAKTQTSSHFAGYTVTGSAKKHIRSAALSFDVPTITCHKHDSGVGPSLLLTSTVVKNTYSFSGGGIIVACENGTVQYLAVPVVDQDQKPDESMTITPGDKITVKVAYGAKTTVKLTDDTTKISDTVTGKKSVGGTAYFGDDGLQLNSKSIGVDAFTKTSFSGATVNGRAIGRQKPTHDTWVDRHKRVQVAASGLVHGNAFTTSFKRAN